MLPSRLPPPSPSRPALRAAALTIGALETLAIILFASLMLQSADPLGAALGRGVTTLMAIPYVAFALPGLILAWKQRYEPLALVLVVLAVPVAAYLWQIA